MHLHDKAARKDAHPHLDLLGSFSRVAVSDSVLFDLSTLASAQEINDGTMWAKLLSLAKDGHLLGQAKAGTAAC